MRFQAINILILLLLSSILPLPLVLASEVKVKIQVYDYNGERVGDIGYVVVYTSPEGMKSYIVTQGKSDENGLILFTLTEEEVKGLVSVSFYKGTFKVGKMSIEYPKLEYETFLELFDLEVRVIEEDGDPVDYALVSVSWEEIYGVVEISNRTGPNGEPAILEDVPPIDVAINVSKLNLQLKTFNVRVGSENYMFKVVVGSLYDLKVRVVDAGDNPLPNVPVYLGLESGVPIYTEYTGEGGEVVFTGLPRGRYFVGANYRGVLYEKSFKLESDGELTIKYNFYVKTTETTQTTSETTTPTTTSEVAGTSKAGATLTTRTMTITAGRPPTAPTRTSTETIGRVGVGEAKPTKTQQSTLQVVVPPPSQVVGEKTVTIELIEASKTETIGRIIGGFGTYTTTLPPGEYIVRVYGEEKFWASERTITIEGGGESLVLRISSPSISFGEIILYTSIIAILGLVLTLTLMYVLKFKRRGVEEVS